MQRQAGRRDVRAVAAGGERDHLGRLEEVVGGRVPRESDEQAAGQHDRRPVALNLRHPVSVAHILELEARRRRQARRRRRAEQHALDVGARRKAGLERHVRPEVLRLEQLVPRLERRAGHVLRKDRHLRLGAEVGVGERAVERAVLHEHLRPEPGVDVHRHLHFCEQHVEVDVRAEVGAVLVLALPRRRLAPELHAWRRRARRGEAAEVNHGSD